MEKKFHGNKKSILPNKLVPHQKQERKSALDAKKDESEESDLDFGDDDDDDSDDDYEESKPWQQKKAKSTVSRLDQMSDDESDESVAAKKGRNDSSAAPQSEAPKAEAEDFAKVTIPRRRLARWCNEPFFTKAVKDSFVRLMIGEDEDGEKAYRLCQIVGVVKGDKTYKFPTANRKDIPVRNVMLLCRGFLIIKEPTSQHFLKRFQPTSC